MIAMLKSVYLALMFVLEIAMLIILGYWGLHNTNNRLAGYALAICLPLLAAVLWGRFAAPRSAHRLTLPYRIVFSLTLFGIAALLLFKTGHITLAIVFGLTALACQLSALFFER
ncbi:YrdB family protein [Spirosoma aureum]|uniref:YrdB family protein n=2 Tax=Spirosoma aureum TaxID=2692134 RepID=A0A6G9AJC7_9BACT|nr:YrdB family protein [Spirosoma aureum]